MRKRRGIAAIAALALLGALATAAGAHDIKNDSKVKLKELETTKAKQRGGAIFMGRVTGEKKACSKKRVVTLYRKEQGKPVAEVDNGQTAINGKFELTEGAPQEAKYYVRAAKRSYGAAGHDHTCLSAKSNTLEVVLP